MHTVKKLEYARIENLGTYHVRISVPYLGYI